MMSQRDDEPMSEAASEREDEKMAPSSPKSAPKEETKPKRSPRKERPEDPKRRNSFTFQDAQRALTTIQGDADAGAVDTYTPDYGFLDAARLKRMFGAVPTTRSVKWRHKVAFTQHGRRRWASRSEMETIKLDPTSFDPEMQRRNILTSKVS